MRQFLFVLVVVLPLGTSMAAQGVMDMDAGAVIYEGWYGDGEVFLEEITFLDVSRDMEDQDQMVLVGIAREAATEFLAGDGEGKVTSVCNWDGEVLVMDITSFAPGSDEIKQARKEGTDSEECFWYFLAPGCAAPFLQSLQSGCQILSQSWSGHYFCWSLRYTYRCPGSTLAWSSTATKTQYNNWATGDCALPTGYCPGCQ